MRAHMCARVCTHVCTHMCVCTHNACTHMVNVNAYTHVCAYTRVYTHVCVHMCVYAHVRTHMNYIQRITESN